MNKKLGAPTKKVSPYVAETILKECERRGVGLKDMGPALLWWLAAPPGVHDIIRQEERTLDAEKSLSLARKLMKRKVVKAVLSDHALSLPDSEKWDILRKASDETRRK